MLVTYFISYPINFFMPQLTFNYAAIVVCGVVYMVIGMVWYGPLFNKTWAKMNGFDLSDKKKMKEMQKKAGPSYVVSFIGSLVMAYVLSMFLDLSMAKTAMDGVITGFWAWLGFVAPTSLCIYMFTQKPVKLWMIDSGYALVSLLAFGAILAAWV